MSGRNSKEPLLPRWAVTTIALVVTAGWVAAVIAALRNPASSGSLITVSGLLTIVLGAIFGYTDRMGRKRAERRNDQGEDDLP